MVATPARIGFVMEEWRRVIATSALPKERYDNLARESDDPVESYFDNTTDAQILADRRQALLDQERRRFTVRFNGVGDALEMDYLRSVPVARYINEHRRVNRPVLICDLSIELDKDETVATVWG